MKLKLIEDGDSEMVWVSSRPMLDSDWPVYFFVVLEYCEKFDREWAKGGKYHGSVQVVAPEACRDRWASAAEFVGMDPPQFETLEEHQKDAVLRGYGIRATLWQGQGSNKRGLLKEARTEIRAINILFGCYMDRKQNMIGESGWDFVEGGAGSTLSRPSTPTH